MSQILSIDTIKHKDSCFLESCGEDAMCHVQIEYGPATVQLCLCPKHAAMSADEILAALNSHKRVYRCPRHGDRPNECDCFRESQVILEEMNRDRPSQD
jgi:hypothetical protein